MTTTQLQARADNNPASALRPLVLDIGIPLGSYYALHAAGCGVVLSLALASVFPAARSVVALIRDRKVNALAILIVVVNLVSMAISFSTGDPRLMLAKDSAVTSVIGIAIVISVLAGRPLMTAGMRPFLVKGNAIRETAFDRLLATSPRFRRLEKGFSLTWGFFLLAECVARVVCVYTLPVATMVWLSTVLMIAAIGLSIVASARFSGPMEKMVSLEASR